MRLEAETSFDGEYWRTTATVTIDESSALKTQVDIKCAGYGSVSMTIDELNAITEFVNNIRGKADLADAQLKEYANDNKGEK